MKSIRPSAVLAVGAIIIGLLCLKTVWNNEWVPNAVLAHVANVADNLAHGRGYQSDGISDYLISRQSARHPEDVLAPGLPTVIGLVFKITGKSIVGVYVPAVIFFILAGLATYLIGKTYFSPWVGVVGAYLVWMNVTMSQMAISGLAHTGFVLFFFLTLHFSERSFSNGGRLPVAAVAGLVCALAFYMNFKAIVLVVAFPAWAMIRKFEEPSNSKPKRIKTLLVAAFLGVFVLMTLPWVVRNFKVFGAMTYPTWGTRVAMRITKPRQIDRPGPISSFQRIYNDADRPSLSDILGVYGPYWLGIVKPRVELYRLFKVFLNYGVLEVGIFLFGLIGLFLSWIHGHKRFVTWHLLVGASCLLWLFQGGYQHVYFGVFIPSAALFCSYFLIDFGKWVRHNISERGALVYALLLISLFGMTSFMYWKVILKQGPPIDFPRQINTLNDWINKNVGPDEAVITRMPQLVAFGTGRGALATPFGNWATMLEMRDKYNAQYLVMEIPGKMAEAFLNQNPETLPLMELLPLFQGNDAFGARKVFSVDDAFDVYRMPPSNERGAIP